MQDIQNGASSQQIDQDLLGVLSALTTDLTDIEAELGTASGAPSSSGVPVDGGSSTAASGSATGSDNSGTGASTGTGSDTTGTSTPATPGSGSSATAAQNATSSVAEITANDGGGNEEIGTAFFVNSSGLLATDDHVVTGSQGPIQVQLSDGQTVNAQVVEQDPGNDLALLQVQGAGSQQFTPVSIASPSSVSATDSAIGFPDAGPLQVDSGQYAGLATYGSFDVSSPVASNPNREMEQFTNMDAQPGSSGSPIFNAQGQVVGIVDIGDGYGDTDATLSSALTADIAQVQA
jgi:S1-C subfamily serine protease